MLVTAVVAFMMIIFSRVLFKLFKTIFISNLRTMILVHISLLITLGDAMQLISGKVAQASLVLLGQFSIFLN